MTTPCDIVKRREIVFDPFPPDQVGRAMELLSGLPDLETRRASAPHTFEISYRIDQYHLEAIEAALEAQGFHLFNTLLTRLKRALVYYCERTQLENMQTVETASKNFSAFVSDWAKRPHGDRDETPAEWRQYK